MRTLPRLLRAVAFLGLLGGMSAQALPPQAHAQGLAPSHVAAITVAPTLGSPANGTRFQSIAAITLNWSLPSGSTQYQIQLSPFNNDGPGINLIRDAATTYTIEPPVLGQGPYVILPGMTYTWRVRATDKTSSVDEGDASWGPWSEAWTFTTPPPSATSIVPVEPPLGATVSGRVPSLRWSDSNAFIFYYELQLSKDRNFDTNPSTASASVYMNLIHGGQSNPPNTWTVPSAYPLEPATRYFWRLRPRVQGNGTPVAWSSLFFFDTPGGATPPAATPVPTAPTATPAPASPTGPTQPSGSNLLVNGDAEAGRGAANDGEVVAPPGWSVNGNLTAVQYGAPGGFIGPSDPGPSSRGKNYFVGGPSNGESSATQTVNLAGNAGSIDSGSQPFTLSAWLGGWNGQDDSCSVRVSFQSGSGSELRTASIGPVPSSERNGGSALVLKSTTGNIPSGTRSAAVTLTCSRSGGSYNDGAADNIDFRLGAGDSTPPAAPATPTPAQTGPTQPSGSNLLVNGDAEAGRGAANDGEVVAPPGWSVNGNLTAVQYGAPGGFIGPSDPGPSSRGKNYFVGGPSNGESSATQTVNLAGNAGSIDSGSQPFTLSAWLGGWDGQDDSCSVRVSFQSGSGSELRTASIGPVPSSERNGGSALVLKSTTGNIPSGTRSAAVTLTCSRSGGSYNDGAADNIDFRLGAGASTPPAATPTPAPATPTPAPSTPPVASGSNLLVNGDAETGRGAANDGEVVAPPGWTPVGNVTQVQYGAAGGFVGPGDPGPSSRGKNYFVGGPSNGESSAFQVVSLTGNVSSIDSGSQTFTLSAWLGGWDGQDDNAQVTVAFRGASENVLRSFTIGPVLGGERGGGSALVQKSVTGTIPSGTRSAYVAMKFTRTGGSYNDGAADNIDFRLGGGGSSGGSGGGSVAASCSTVLSRSVVSSSAEKPNGPTVSVFKVGNDAGVANGGTSTTVSLAKDTWLVDLWTYHWNGGRGVAAGKTAMIAADGTVYGPWQTELVSGVYWVAKPQTWLKAGSYTVCDSDPSTWAQNSGTNGQGMSWATGVESVGI